MNIIEVSTTPYAGQRPGTSGLRQTVTEFSKPNYVENFVQSIFDSLPSEEIKGKTLLVSGDGRYYSKEAFHKIAEIAAGNGIGRLWVGLNGLISTPAASVIIRERQKGVCIGGILLTASHNPGGPSGDFGIKYNMANGGPAVEQLTNRIYQNTLKIQHFKKVNLPDIDLTKISKTEIFPGFIVEVIDSTEDWIDCMKRVFDFELIRKLIKRPDFKMVFDAMHGVAGPYAIKLFHEILGIDRSCLLNCIPLEDFGGLHPDPNLVHAKELSHIMGLDKNISNENIPCFGAAADGDADRNMILGKNFFVTPSDSVAMITAYGEYCIPHLRNGITGVARSMPTSRALDKVAEKKNIASYEVPTGWKFFGNLMDNKKISLCGEESFGTGCDHIREKDGLWAVLAWLSILAYHNNQNEPFVHINHITERFWKEYGRYYYTRYDYENIETEKANKLMERLHMLIANKEKIMSYVPQKYKEMLSHTEYHLDTIDDFTYIDPIDNSKYSNQGVRFIFSSGARIVVRLSGTGSVNATVRIYFEKYDATNISDHSALNDLIELGVALTQIKEICQRSVPNVIT